MTDDKPDISALEKLTIKEGDTVVYYTNNMSLQMKDVIKRLAKFSAERGAWFVCLPAETRLSVLSDGDLKKMGLERVSDAELDRMKKVAERHRELKKELDL